MPEWAIQLITSTGIAGVFALYLWLVNKRLSSRESTDNEFRIQLLSYVIQLTNDFNKTMQNHMHHETVAMKELAQSVSELSVLIKQLCVMWEDNK